MFIYLDESGDLGFDFGTSGCSKYFVITLLVMSQQASVTFIEKVVSRTLQTKVNNKKKRARIVNELKGSQTDCKVKKYFLKQMSKLDDWSCYAIILDKKKIFRKNSLPLNKNNLYDELVKCLLNQVDFGVSQSMSLRVDMCKTKINRLRFNDFLRNNLRLISKDKIFIEHVVSEQYKTIQAVDMFCYGVAKKYEANDCEWYNHFKHRIIKEFEYGKIRRGGTVYVVSESSLGPPMEVPKSGA